MVSNSCQFWGSHTSVNQNVGSVKECMKICLDDVNSTAFTIMNDLPGYCYCHGFNRSNHPTITNTTGLSCGSFNRSPSIPMVNCHYNVYFYHGYFEQFDNIADIEECWKLCSVNSECNAFSINTVLKRCFLQKIPQDQLYKEKSRNKNEYCGVIIRF